MQLSINKTKEMVVDLRRQQSPITPLSIGEVGVEIAQGNKERSNLQERSKILYVLLRI